MRRVGVIVDADISPFAAALGTAAGQTLAFRKLLDGIDDRIDVKIKVDDRGGLSKAAVDSRTLRSEIDTLSGRLGVGLDLLAMFGPAAAPITALAVPALAGLATQATVAGAAGLTAVLAFQGMGDALGAIEKARLDPTVANLQAAQAALSELTPAAAEFAEKLAEARGRIGSATVDAAGEGMFPGLTQALDDVDAALPRAEKFFRTMGDLTGDLAADNAESLTSGRWTEFVDYIESEGRPTLTAMNAAVGDLVHGLSELVMAGDPLADDFTGWMRDGLDDFDAWASGVDDTQGYQDFVAYVRDNGPEVAETASAIGSALLDIGIAAAPLGGPALAGLEALANVVSTIADSPLGTPLLALAGILATLNRGMAIVGKVKDFNAQGTAAGRTWTAAAGVADKTSKSYMGLRSSMAAVAAEQNSLYRKTNYPLQHNAAQHAAIAKTAGEARRNLTGYGAAAGKAAAGVGALALVSTGLGEDLGVQNSALLGITGAMLGPWGAAIGAGVGLAIDFAAANDDIADAIEGAQNAMKSQDMSAMKEQYASLAEEIDSTQADVDAFWTTTSPRQLISGGRAMFSDDLEKAREEAQAITDMQMAMYDLGAGMGLPQDMLADLTKVAEHAAPALQSLGYDYEDMLAAFRDDPLGEGAWGDMQREIEASLLAMDSGQARTRAFADSVADLANEQLRTADTAGAMSSALNSLLSPTLNAEEATDAWRTSLRGLSEEIDGAAGFRGMTDAAVANRAVTRDYVRDFQAMITARAEAGAGSKQIASLVDEARSSFVREGVAAGVSAKEMRRRADALGLTPKLVTTTFRAAGIGPIERQARDLKGTYQGMPKQIRTMIRTGNVPQTEGQINRLVRKYELTGRQRRALISLRDLATKDINKVLRGLGIVDRKKSSPKADLVTGQFDGKRRGLERQMGMLDRKKTTPKIDADNNPANKAMSQTATRLGQLNAMKASPNVGADVGGALGGIGAVQSALAGLNSKTIYVTTVQRTRRENALGGFWPAAEMFALGGIKDRADAHMPELAPAGGPLRVWGEKETQGEGYVPLANDYRRPGAKVVTEQIVDHFGGRVEWFANGGHHGPGAVRFRQHSGAGAANVDLRGLTIQGRVTGEIDADGFLKGQLRGLVVDEIEGHAAHDADRRRVGGRP